MVLLPELISPTVQAIYDRYEEKAKDWRRPHLGASVIGRSCARSIWYLFRWAAKPEKSGRIVALLGRGDREETRIARDLRGIGVELKNREHGKQIRISFGPHTGGSLDGEVLGFREAPATWHVFECKTSNSKNFSTIKSGGVKKAKPEHWAQMQIYMKARGRTRAGYFVVNKDTDEIYMERVELDQPAALALEAKAEMTVFAKEPLTRISESPSWWECKFCDHLSHCQLGQLGALQRNCRTCLSSTPMRDGTWRCDLKSKTLTVGAQKKGCKEHRFIPAMMTGLVPKAAVGRDVTYDSGLVDQGQKL